MNVEVSQSVAFVLEYAGPGDRVLEVGCGSGALAAELGRRGLKLLAMDHSADAVTAARARGVDAVHADFLSFEQSPFDALLFSRSLHHIHPLEQTVSRAERLLKPGGLVLVEDFSVEAPDLATAQWYYGVESLLSSIGWSPESADAMPDDPLDRWFQDHNGEHHIATRQEMTDRLLARFRLIAEQPCPYLYRYFVEHLDGQPARQAVVEAIFRWESESIKKELLRAVGWRSAWSTAR